MYVKFWGTRGSIPTPGPETVRHGGNTACVEVRAGSSVLILDAGTGIRKLGIALSEKAAAQPLHVHLLMTHTHWDHIQGLPFFSPIYMPHNRIVVCGRGDMDTRLHQIFAGQMDQVYFPVEFSQLPCEVTFFEFTSEEFEIKDILVHTYPLHHPGGGVAYRISHEGKSLVYATDNEICRPVSTKDHLRLAEIKDADAGSSQHNLPSVLEEDMIQFGRNADLAILDAQYTNEECAQRVGWGHSSAEHAVELALQAGVRKVALFHHDPERTDDQLDQMVENCRALIRERGGDLECFAAAEGLEINL